MNAQETKTTPGCDVAPGVRSAPLEYSRACNQRSEAAPCSEHVRTPFFESALDAEQVGQGMNPSPDWDYGHKGLLTADLQLWLNSVAKQL